MKKILIGIVAFMATIPTFGQFASGGFTLEEENHNTYGVNFEQAFPYLLELLEQ